MAAVWMRLRAEARSRWRAWVGLALLAGLAGGLVTAAAAGARRTQSAYGRMLEATAPHDVFLYQFSDVGLSELDPEEVAALPQVASAARLSWFWADLGTPVGIAIPRDESLGSRIDRASIVAGRRARPDAPDEATVGFAAADKYGLRVGSSLTLFPAETPGEPPELKPFRDAFVAGGFPLELRVVGIQAGPYDLPPITIGSSIVAYATPALYRIASSLENALQSSVDSVAVRLRNGSADIRAFERELRTLAGPDPQIEFAPLADTAASVRNAIAPLGTALWLFAGVLGVAGLLIVGQSMSRHVAVSSDENVTLGAVGMTPSQQWMVATGRAVGIGIASAAIAAGIAVVLSPVAPLGVARVAEPEPGIRVDLTAIGIGALAIVSAIVLLGAIPAWRATSAGAARRSDGEVDGGASRTAQALARSGGPVTVVTGAHLALSRGSRRSAVPVRSTVFGISLAVTALAASLGVAASLNHLLATPRLYGRTWDLQLIQFEARADLSARAATLQSEAGIEAVTYGATTPVEIEGRSAEAHAITPLRGDAYPTIVDGRRPSAADEIALGARTLRTLGAGLGDRVDVSLVDGVPRPMTIVGRVVSPALAQGELGESPMLDWETSRAVLAASDQTANTLFVRFAPGADVEALTGRIEDLIISAEDEPFIELHDLLAPNETPRDVVNFGRVENLPLVLSAALAALSAAVLAHMVASSVRRRRRDLAILKALGLQRRQLRAAVGWQATLLVALALTVGVPTGVIGGRWAWTSLADRVGVAPAPRVPVAALLLLLPAALLLANLVAAIPGGIAARTQPALVLRAE